MRRRSRTQTNRTTNRHGVIPNSGVLNERNGIQAPIYTKQPQLSNRSITVKKIWSWVSVLKCPSQLIAEPAQKHVRWIHIVADKRDRTCSECSKEVVAAERTRDPDRKQRECQILGDVGLAVQQSMLLRQFE